VYEQYVAGMQIDLDGPDTTSAALYAYGGGGSLELNTDPDSDLFVIRSGPGEDDNILFYIGRKDNREFYMQSDNYVEGSTGTNINLYDGTISIYKDNGSYVLLDGEGSPYFQIHDGDSGKDIFIAGDSQFQLESTNFVSGESGIFIDLQAGEFEARAGVIGGWTINQSTITAESVTLDSAGNLSGGSKYQWSILEDGTATFKYLVSEEGGIIGPFTISEDALYISGGTFEGSTVYLGKGGVSVNNKAFSASAQGDVYISGNLEVCGKSKLSGGLEVGTGDGAGGAIYSGGAAGKGFYNFGVNEANIGPWKIDKDAISTETGSKLGANGELILTNGTGEFKILEGKGLTFSADGTETFSINGGLAYDNTNGLFKISSAGVQLRGGIGAGTGYLSMTSSGVWLSGSSSGEVGYIQLGSANAKMVGGGGGKGSRVEVDQSGVLLSINGSDNSFKLTADTLVVDGLTCKKDQYVKIRNILGSTRVNLRFHKGLLVTDLGEEGSASGDPDAVEVGDDLIVKGHISAFKPGQTTGAPVALGKMAFVDDVTKKVDVTATGSITTYVQNGYKDYYSGYDVDYDYDDEGNISGVDVDIYPVTVMTYKAVTRTVKIVSNDNAVTIVPNEGTTVGDIPLTVSGTASWVD
jgi:hypothetical protein